MNSKMFVLPESTVISAVNCDDQCSKFAVLELQRLLKKLGTESEIVPVTSVRGQSAIFIAGNPMHAGRASAGRLRFDGYKLTVSPAMVLINSHSSKGLLNGVYGLAERLGVTFLIPGDDNEFIAPEAPYPLPVCEVVFNPRTARRGVYADFSGSKFSPEEWLKFYAKLRFNTVGISGCEGANNPGYGLRTESYGHSFAELVPGELFETHPEYFPMDRPEEQDGMRIDNGRFCTGSAEAWKTAEKNLRSKCRDVYSLHLAGGNGESRCMCPVCRGYTASEQKLLTARMLADKARKNGFDTKIPVEVGHDSYTPETQFRPDPEGNFMEFVPNGRCYGHALHDIACTLNRHYLNSLKVNRLFFRACSDMHAVESYCDSKHFRGMAPFIPRVLLADYLCYSRHGVESMITRQAGGDGGLADYNLLLFAAAGWNQDLWADTFTEELTVRLAGKKAGAPLRDFLNAKGEIFEEVMKWCGNKPGAVESNYRYLPEKHASFCRDRVKIYRNCASKLTAAAEKLAKAMESMPENLRKIADGEVKRAGFEAAVLELMSSHQDALCHIADGRTNNSIKQMTCGIELLKELAKALPASRKKAADAGMEEGYYCQEYCELLERELKGRVKAYEQLLRQDSGR